MNPVIINAYYRGAGWYGKGQDRLLKSLKKYWPYDVKTWRKETINAFCQPDFPYTIKAAALQQAIWDGYTKIIWLDCSVWSIRPLSPLVDIVNSEGGYFWSSGYNIAQTAADSDLQWAGWTRDYAETMPELASSMFGVDIETERGQTFVHHFLDAANNGVFNTSRYHEGQSQDPRFLFARQDQTAASIAFHKAGFTKMYPPETISSYAYDKKKYNKSVLLLMRGM